jgi:hypothetical protein
MQEGYQIIEIKNRVSDVLTQMSIKVSNVLTVLGQRCADSYHLGIRYRVKIVSLHNRVLIPRFLFPISFLGLLGGEADLFL